MHLYFLGTITRQIYNDSWSIHLIMYCYIIFITPITEESAVFINAYYKLSDAFGLDGFIFFFFFLNELFHSSSNTGVH